MNNTFVIRQGRRFAKRVAREVPNDSQAQADRVFRLAITRAPTPRERLQLATLMLKRLAGAILIGVSIVLALL